MPKKKTIDEVRQFINDSTDGKTLLLSDEYINSKTPLKLKCSCGNIFYRKYDKLKTNGFNCVECSKKELSKRYSYSLDDIKKIISDKGCEYISGEYVNETSKLTIKCKCGKEFIKSFNKFNSGQDHCPKCGMKALAEKKTKYNLDSARELLRSYGFELLENEYLGAQEKMLCKCRNGHESYIVISQLKHGRSGCRECATERMKGNLHYNYQGGVSIVSEAIRRSLAKWKEHIRNLYNDTCPVTGEKEETVVHHLLTLRDMYDEITSEYGETVGFYDKICDFSSYKIFDEIRNEIVKRHNNTTGILISRELHIAYHREYGYRGNTSEQFNDFLLAHYSIPLTDVLVGGKNNGNIYKYS